MASTEFGGLAGGGQSIKSPVCISCSEPVSMSQCLAATCDLADCLGKLVQYMFSAMQPTWCHPVGYVKLPGDTMLIP